MVKIAPEEEPVSEGKAASIPLKSTSRLMKMSLEKDSASGEDRIRYAISDRVIDSLNSIVPLYDPEKYSPFTVSYFSTLAESLHGRTFYADNPDSLVYDIMEILTSRLNEGTDIVFLIDKTGSMDDDIDTVKQNLNIIMDYLSKFSRVKVGMALYGDKNFHYDLWYNRTDLTHNIDEVRNFMDTYKTLGNADTPESVNDGIVRTVREMNWTPGNRRLMLVIGDACSQQPPMSGYTNAQVIRACDSMQVKFNLYPIVLAATKKSQATTYVKADFVSVYPNPANEACYLQIKEKGNYYYEINDMSGKALLNSRISSTDRLSRTTVRLGDLPAGSYLVQVYNEDISRYYSMPLIIQH